MVAGDLVPLATIGTVMPGGMEIARRKMRGQESNGMLCSAREMELGDDHDGILVLSDAASTPGTPITDALGIVARRRLRVRRAAEPTRHAQRRGRRTGPGRAPAGAVRDAATRARRRVGGEPTRRPVRVDIQAPDLCGRFLARVLSGVQLGPSPQWMAQRLIAAGHAADQQRRRRVQLRDARAGSAQPHLRPGDAARAGVLGTRWARDGERSETLDGVERTLGAADGVIVDGDDRVIGIWPGSWAAPRPRSPASTTDVVLELAWWDPAAIAATSTRLNLHSEASLRFKRGVDPEIAPLAARRFAQLLAEVGGATLHPGAVDADGRPAAAVRPCTCAPIG